jgi:hypothetical protein
MKTAGIGSFLLLIITLSCQSEYERQLAEGKDMVEKEVSQLNDSEKQAKATERKTQEDLQKCAHLSGNKSLFLSTIEDYRSNLKEMRSSRHELTKKFP